MPPPTLLRHIHLPSTVPFTIAQTLQSALVAQFLNHKALLSSPSSSHSQPVPLPPAPQPTILTFTPTPVYTFGRRDPPSSFPKSFIETLLQPHYQHGFERAGGGGGGEQVIPEAIHTLRGGQTTFHGPGQLVVYPILDLKSAGVVQESEKFPRGIGVRDYVQLLEGVTISVLGDYGVQGVTTENPGVWVKHLSKIKDGEGREEREEKIAALGVHLRRNITSFGVGLNIYTDLTYFDRIVACGLEGKGTTSLQQIWTREEKKRMAVHELKKLPEFKYDLVFKERWGRKRKFLRHVADMWAREFGRRIWGVGGDERVVRVGVKELGLDLEGLGIEVDKLEGRQG